jgi:tripartite-type tricarboxylate transporter receptor subunit TctC
MRRSTSKPPARRYSSFNGFERNWLTVKSPLQIALLAVAALLAAPSTQAGDGFPARPIHVVVNTAPGGFTDIVARVVAQQMADYLKQPMVVENRAGGDGLIGIRAVKAASADGYTMVAATGTIAQQTALRLDPGYDLMKDFVGIAILGRAPYLMVVSASQPYKTANDFLLRAKASPGKLTYASAGVGTVSHFAAAAYLRQSGVDVVHVPYKGNAPAVPDVMSGRVDMLFDTYTSGFGQVRAGKFRVLGVSSDARLSVLPDVPTLAEQGATKFSFYTWVGFFVPAGTPKEVVERLAQAVSYAKSTDAVKAKFRDEGMESVDMSGEKLAAFLAGEVEQSKRLVSDLKIDKY